MPKISIFKNVAETKTPRNVELEEYLDMVKDGMWQDESFLVRNAKDDASKKEIKKTLPTVTMSGMFSSRNDASLLSHSEIIAIDIDNITEDISNVKVKLQKDKYTYSVFFSIGGNGLRLLVKIDPNKHRESFAGISDYLFTNYGIVVDPNGSNVSKPYLVTYDPHLYLNRESVLFKKYIKETPIKRMTDFVHTAGDFGDIIKQIQEKRVNICESYNDWVKVCFAISEQFGEDGREYFHIISDASAKYKEVQADKQFTNCLKARGSTKINISTFYYLAKINGINISSERTKAIVKTTRNGKKAGLTKEQIIINLQKFSDITGADEVVNTVFDSQGQEDYNDDDSLLDQLEMFISNNYNLVMNEVTGFLEQSGRQLTPGDLNTIFIAAKKLLPKLDYNLMIRLLKSDFIPSYNPFFKFFGSDGMPYDYPTEIKDNSNQFESPLIDKLASCILNMKPEYTVYFLRKWIVSIISSAHKQHSELLFCLLGGQNTGKTQFFRRLLPKELQAYYAESKLDKEKDDEILMCENLIIMDDELGGKSKQDADKLKNITSKQWFSLRRPYGDHNEKILRLAVLCGTSNHDVVMNDQTGNRRIIPVEVVDIDKDKYNSIDKKELFMEAFELYKKGFEWRMSREDIEFLNEDRSKFENPVKEAELVEKYFEPCEDGAEKLTTTEILVEIEFLTHQKLSLKAIGTALKTLGFKNRTVRVSAYSTPKKWLVKKINRSSI